jgi:hypothetical protein
VQPSQRNLAARQENYSEFANAEGEKNIFENKIKNKSRHLPCG